MSDHLDEEIRTLRAHFWSDRDPDGRAFAPLAEAYLKRGEVEEALSLVQEGLSRLPDYATGHLVAARIHRHRGDPGAAHQAVEALLSLDSGNAAGLRIRGELAEEAGDLETARTAFQQALRRNPAYSDLTGRISRLEQGEPEELGPERAEEPEEVAKPVEPEEPAESAEPNEPLPGAHFTRTMGDLYARQGLLERAVAVYRHLSERDPGNPELADRLMELEGRLAGADQAEEEVHGEDPGSDAFQEDSGSPWDEADAAPQWADREGGGGLETGSTPFAWAGEDGEEEMAEEPDGPSIATYFEDLLAWEPGAVPVGALSPGGTEAVPIESLAPRPEPVAREDFEREAPMAEDSRSEASGGQEAGGGMGEADSDSDFQAWIRSLRS